MGAHNLHRAGALLVSRPLTGADLRTWRESVPVPARKRGRPTPGLTLDAAGVLFGCSPCTISRAESQPAVALQPWLAESLASAVRDVSPSWRARLREAMAMGPRRK